MRNRESTRSTGHAAVPSGMKSGKSSAGKSWGDCKGQGELWSRPQLSKARKYGKR